MTETAIVVKPMNPTTTSVPVGGRRTSYFFKLGNFCNSHNHPLEGAPAGIRIDESFVELVSKKSEKMMRNTRTASQVFFVRILKKVKVRTQIVCGSLL